MAEKTTLAKPYAKAIFEIASQDNTVDSWLEKLELLSQVSSVDTVLEVIKNPEISTDDTINMFTDICKDELNVAERITAGHDNEVTAENLFVKTDPQPFPY